MPEESVKLPGGIHLKKKVAIGLGIAAVSVAAYVLYRQRQQNSGSTGADQTQSGDTSSSGIDPQTGYAYGSPEDQAALAAMSGAGLPGYGGGGYYLGGPGTSGGGQTNPGGFVSNDQWTQAAEAFMGSNGADAIAAALGKYLLGTPLTSDQVTIVQEAIAAEGIPPVAGTAGFPPSYKTAPGPPPHPGGTAKNPVKGLRAEPRFTQIDVHWSPLDNATQYLVKAHLGSRVAQQVKVNGTFATLHDLKRNTSYRITVWGEPGTGTNASVTARTKS